MNTCHRRPLAAWLLFAGLTCTNPVAVAQTVPAAKDAKVEDATKLEKFVVTGSMIKRIEGEGALPLQTITPLEMEQRGVVGVEDMLMDLNINGNGLDNL